jgi:hypothetical protein
VIIDNSLSKPDPGGKKVNSKLIHTAGHSLVITLMLGAVLYLGACGPRATDQPVRTEIPATPAVAQLPTPAATANAGSLTDEALKNAEYRLPDLGTFRLRDGQFEYSYGSGATQVNKVGFLQAARGDLDGDGQADAAVTLWATTGGSGIFIYLVAILNEAGSPRQVAADMVGDRVQIQQMSVQGEKIAVVAKAFAKDDPKCCPSLQVTRTYQLKGTALEVVSETK